MDEVYIVRLPVSQITPNSQNCFFFLESTWKEDCLLLSISNGSEELTGTIQFELFQNISESLEMEYESFFIETKKAITTNKGVSGFHYIINEKQFIWKKDGNENFKIIYGTTNLMKCRNIQNILSNSVDIISNLKSQLADKNNELMTVMEQLNDSKKYLKQATIYKEVNEKELFTKFICLLNAKKAKINELISPTVTSDDERFNKRLFTQTSNQSCDSSAAIQNLPKRKKFQPLKKMKPVENVKEDNSCQQSLAEDDLFKDM